MTRSLTYSQAIREAIDQELARDASVVLLGDSSGVEEGLMTGVAVGMAAAGLRPIKVHTRTDLLIPAVNQIVTAAARVRSMFDRPIGLPLVVHGIVGPGQFRPLFSSLTRMTGLRIVAPTTPHDAKGALIAAIRGSDPVLLLEHRLLSDRTGMVPEEPYTIPLGNARVLAEGAEITLVGISHQTVPCLQARDLLADAGISCEVIDALSLNPLDAETVAASVEKTGRLLVVDDGSTDCGSGAELLARMRERFDGRQAVALERLGNRSSDASQIASRAYAIVTHDPSTWTPAVKAAS
jgi:pyruvate/2-oxoglutarate/acetoin dehydrogenase E1 component